MVILQFLGLVIPALTLLFIYGWAIKECIKGNGKESVPMWVVVITLFLCLILGFTIVTLVL